MNDNEHAWDSLLNISTIGRDDLKADQYHHPYEPTPYSVLERLVSNGLITENDVVLDYGCGKGRVSFYLSHQTKAQTIGIEYDARILDAAADNLRTAVSKENTHFVLTRAEEFDVPLYVNRCYFFNPFSVEILRGVFSRILQSYYENPREILLFFYYPADDYISYLMSVNELDFYDEIECDDLFPNDIRERILIFKLSDYE